MVAIGVSWRIRQLCCFLLVVLVGADIAMIHAFTGTYGINYGRFANNIPSPDRVVTLLKAAKIKNVRIYNVDRSVLRAFRGSGLELEVVVPNEILVNMSSSTDHASNWVKQNIQPYFPDTDIRGIAVGNEILAIEDEDIQEALVGAVKNIYSAVEGLHLKDKIVIWTPHSQAVFQNSFPPSSCTFKESVLPYTRRLSQFFSQIGSPFFVNVYPFLSYKSNPKDIDINYALFNQILEFMMQKQNSTTTTCSMHKLIQLMQLLLQLDLDIWKFMFQKQVGLLAGTKMNLAQQLKMLGLLISI